MTPTGPDLRLRLLVTGTVQGVGFRPHVHRLATALELTGLVGNDSTSVFIEVQGPPEALASFQQDLRDQAPPLARIDAIEATELPLQSSTGFHIAQSLQTQGPVTTAPPDTAPCRDCLAEMADPDDRRYRYPFITCTNCGPRFTIITALPYDRPTTTMVDFPLCGPCTADYEDVTDRRFHAQPVACADCGPRIWLEESGQVDPDVYPASTDGVVAATQQRLADGAIVAIKGVGGFHLACSADDNDAVATLRRRKERPGKPFAVMAPNLTTARQMGDVGKAEADLLTSPAAPIVLVRRRDTSLLADGVAPGNPLVGIMLPSSPLHHLLFSPTPDGCGKALGPLVMTSGNVSEEPICTDNDEARQRLRDIADVLLLHDRPIAVACDDSVVRVDGPTRDTEVRLTMIRRSRGYVPTPIPLPFAGRATLAVGGQLKTTAGLTDGRQVWLSQHIGDMGSLATLEVFDRTVQRFAAMHDVNVERLATDAHPEYTTRRWAIRHAGGRPVIDVQHHHAHIASVMCEHGLDGSQPVLGVAFDGTGYGPDGTIWGGEFLLADYAGFRRVAHLSTVLLPGGDAAIRHPRRVALSHLRTAGIEWAEDLAPVAATPAHERTVLAQQLKRGLACVPTSSMGRLFDAVSSLLGITHDITFEAQAAISLEIIAAEAASAGHLPAKLQLPVVPGLPGSALEPPTGAADAPLGAPNQPLVLDAPSLIRDLVDALARGADVATLALGFHHAIATAVAQIATLSPEVSVVALSGGVFTNALLTRLVTRSLAAVGVTVLTHRLVPPNDGGLALGQIAVGAHS